MEGWGGGGLRRRVRFPGESQHPASRLLSGAPSGRARPAPPPGPGPALGPRSTPDSARPQALAPPSAPPRTPATPPGPGPGKGPGGGGLSGPAGPGSGQPPSREPRVCGRWGSGHWGPGPALTASSPSSPRRRELCGEEPGAWPPRTLPWLPRGPFPTGPSSRGLLPWKPALGPPPPRGLLWVFPRAVPNTLQVDPYLRIQPLSADFLGPAQTTRAEQRACPCLGRGPSAVRSSDLSLLAQGQLDCS